MTHLMIYENFSDYYHRINRFEIDVNSDESGCLENFENKLISEFRKWITNPFMSSSKKVFYFDIVKNKIKYQFQVLSKNDDYYDVCIMGIYGMVTNFKQKLYNIFNKKKSYGLTRINGHRGVEYYRCDQFDGLVKFINDICELS